MNTPTFADLLRQAVTEPGIISTAYRQFHNYSIGNQLLAWSQCLGEAFNPARWQRISDGANLGDTSDAGRRP